MKAAAAGQAAALRARISGMVEALVADVPPWGRRLAAAGALILFVIVFASLAAPLLSPYSPVEPSGDPLEPPSLRHPLGTDRLGRDVYTRILYGGRIVLWVALLSSLMSAAVGVPLGLVSGYAGGRVDRALSMVMDALYAFPGLILAIALAAVLGPRPENAAAAIAVVYIPTYFRMVRAVTLHVKASPFMEALEALGLPPGLILRRHVLPHVLPTVMVVFSLAAADAVLTEAALSFLGLAVKPPTPDWGFDLYNAKGYATTAPWLVAAPGAAITLLALSLALIGEGLSERVGWR